jgi:hypothetical protein
MGNLVDRVVEGLYIGSLNGELGASIFVLSLSFRMYGAGF